MEPYVPIPLWPSDTPFMTRPGDEPTLTFYPATGALPRGAVIICPGGGYVVRAYHEGEPVARWLNTLGIHAFVLAYRVTPYYHPVPLLDARRAIRTVRHNASEWGIEPHKIGILGFSAGGHLAATVGTDFDSGDASNVDPIEAVSCRPDGLILCYAVISFQEFGHPGVIGNLLGDDPEPAVQASLSLETRVTHETPPTFLWHTADDAVVPVENSLQFASALSRCKVPFELHVYEKGEHGLGLAESSPGVSLWTTACGIWLKGWGF